MKLMPVAGIKAERSMHAYLEVLSTSTVSAGRDRGHHHEEQKSSAYAFSKGGEMHSPQDVHHLKVTCHERTPTP